MWPDGRSKQASVRFASWSHDQSQASATCYATHASVSSPSIPHGVKRAHEDEVSAAATETHITVAPDNQPQAFHILEDAVRSSVEGVVNLDSLEKLQIPSRIKGMCVTDFLGSSKWDEMVDILVDYTEPVQDHLSAVASELEGRAIKRRRIPKKTSSSHAYAYQHVHVQQHTP